MRLRHILTSRQSQGRSTYPFLLRITAHLGFTNPGRRPKERRSGWPAHLPAQKAIQLAALRQLAIVLTLQMATCGFMHGNASGHGPLVRYKVLAYARGRKHERCGVLGPLLRIKTAKYNDPGSSICGIPRAGERLKGTSAAQPAT